MEDGLQISSLLPSAIIQVRDDGGPDKEDVSADGQKGRHRVISETDRTC